MRFAALIQKFEVVSESHRFLCQFVILNRVIALNACRYIYALDSKKRLSLEFFPRTTTKYLSFEANLASVAKSVGKWEPFKEK